MSGDLYARGMGALGSDIIGGSVSFRPDGSTHSTVFGPSGGGRFSWNTPNGGEPRDMHFTDTGYGKRNPLRHPFSG